MSIKTIKSDHAKKVMLLAAAAVFFTMILAGTGFSQEERKITLNLAIDTHTTDLIRIIGPQCGWTLTVTPAAARIKGRINITDTPCDKALDLIVETFGITYVRTGNVIKLMTKQELTEELSQNLITQMYKIKYYPLVELNTLLRGFLSPKGNIYPDLRSSMLIVRDMPERVAEIDYLIKQIDVPVETRVFKLRYIDVIEFQSMVVDLITPIRGNQQVQEKQNTLIVSDTPDKIARIEKLYEELDVPTELIAVPLNYIDEEDYSAVVSDIKTMLSTNAFVNIDKRTKTMIIEDIPSRVERASRYLTAVDQPTKQVFIEADIYSITLSDTFNFSTDWYLSNDLRIDSNTDTLSVVEEDGIVVNPDSALFSLGSSGFTARDMDQEKFLVNLSASLNKSNAELLSSPRIFVKDKYEAKLEVGGEEPFLQTNFDTSGRVTSVTQQSKNVGTILNVTPYINNRNEVELDLSPEISSARRVTLSDRGNAVDALAVDKNSITTKVVAKNHQTVILGGLIRKDISKSRSGVPILMDIPLLGKLFSSTSDEERRQYFLIVITPHIIDSYEGTDFISRYHLDKIDQEGQIDSMRMPTDELKRLSEEIEDQIAPEESSEEMMDGNTSEDLETSEMNVDMNMQESSEMQEKEKAPKEK